MTEYFVIIFLLKKWKHVVNTPICCSKLYDALWRFTKVATLTLREKIQSHSNKHIWRWQKLPHQWKNLSTFVYSKTPFTNISPLSIFISFTFLSLSLSLPLSLFLPLSLSLSLWYLICKLLEFFRLAMGYFVPLLFFLPTFNFVGGEDIYKNTVLVVT